MKLLSSYFLIVETIGPLKKYFVTIFNLGSRCAFFVFVDYL